MLHHQQLQNPSTLVNQQCHLNSLLQFRDFSMTHITVENYHTLTFLAAFP